jgi:uncharacterized repeat protein (TIGR02543 family)
LEYLKTLTAIGGGTISWTIENGDLPDGLTLSSEGVISGTPTVQGTFVFTVKVTNEAGSDMKELSMTIAPAPPTLEYSTHNTVTLTFIEGYEYSIDGTTWQSSNIFTDLSSNTTYTFYQRVAETEDTCESVSSLGLTVITDATLSITTASLPDGTVGSVYYQTLTAIGDPTITWSIESGSLPDGLTLSSSGAISGTPTASGTFSFTVKATASDESEVYGELEITISNQFVGVTDITVTGAGDATTITTDGGTLQMSASVLPADATDKTVTWSVIAGTGTAYINSSGLLTALTNGTVTVIATADDGTEVYGELEIVISGQTVDIGIGSTFIIGDLMCYIITDTEVVVGAKTMGSVSGNLIIPSTVENPNDPGSEYSVTYIGAGAFAACFSLESVTIPASVTFIGEAAFAWCISLTDIHVDAANSNYISVDGVLFDHDMLTLITYPAGKADKSYIVPDSVTHLEDGAFNTCTALESVTIGSSVEVIGGWTFDNCIGLTVLAIPVDTTIKAYAIPDEMIIVRYEGAASVTATSEDGGVTVELSILPGTGISVTDVTVGTARGGNNVAVTGSGTAWAFVTGGSDPYYVTVTSTTAIYAITFNSNGGSFVAQISQDIGTSISAPAAPIKQGHTFAGWYDNLGLTGEMYTFTVMPAENITLYAKWDVNQYTVTLISGTGYTLTAASGSSSPVNYGGSFTFVFSFNEGYEGSSLTMNLNGAPLTVMPDVPYTITDIDRNIEVTISGTITKIKYTISLPSGEGYTVTPSGGSSSPVEHGGSYTLQFTRATGYQGGQVIVNSVPVILDANGRYTITDIKANQNVTVTGVAWITYDVTLPVGTGYTVTPYGGSSSPVNYGGSYTIQFTRAIGYQGGQVFVNGYLVSLDVNGRYTITNITADQTVTVTGVTQITYNVTLPVGTGYTVTPYGGSSSPVNHGGSYTIQFTLATGYNGGQVLVNNVPVLLDANGRYTINNITANQNVTVTDVELNVYTVTIDSTGSGSFQYRIGTGTTWNNVVGNEVYVPHGSTVYIRPVYDSSTEFSWITSVSTDASGVATITNVTSDRYIEGKFQGIIIITGGKLTDYPADRTDPTHVLPSHVTEIGDGAFAGNTHLTSITIPETVTSIGAGAFAGCTGLLAIAIPWDTAIGEGALPDGAIVIRYTTQSSGSGQSLNVLGASYTLGAAGDVTHVTATKSGSFVNLMILVQSGKIITGVTANTPDGKNIPLSGSGSNWSFLESHLDGGLEANLTITLADASGSGPLGDTMVLIMIAIAVVAGIAVAAYLVMKRR